MGSDVINVLLIAIVFLMFVLALPAMVAAVDTSSGSLLENESAAVKSIYSQLPTLFTLVPFLLIGIGFVVALKRL